MLKVECDSCKAPYQVDERRVPPAGIKMRCPKCGHSFLVSSGRIGAAPNPQAPAGPPPSRPQTASGIGVPGSASPLPSISKKTVIGIAPSGAVPVGSPTAVGLPAASATNAPLPSGFSAALGLLEEHGPPVISPQLPT